MSGKDLLHVLQAIRLVAKNTQRQMIIATKAHNSAGITAGRYNSGKIKLNVGSNKTKLIGTPINNPNNP